MVVLMVAYGRQKADGQELHNSCIDPLFYVVLCLRPEWLGLLGLALGL